jgi:hypothetical protein
MAVAGSELLCRLNVVWRNAAKEVRVGRTNLTREDAHLQREQLLGKGSGISWHKFSSTHSEAPGTSK